MKDALRLVSEDPINVRLDKSRPMKWFPADCLHRTDFHCSNQRWLERVLSDTQIFQHIARCNLICFQISGQKILP